MTPRAFIRCVARCSKIQSPRRFLECWFTTIAHSLRVLPTLSINVEYVHNLKNGGP